MSHDENYLPVCVRCCQSPCWATSAVAPVSLTLMIINDTLSLHCAQLQGKATSTAPPPSLCLGHYEKDQVLPCCCWGAAHPFRITLVHSKQSLCFPCDFSSLTVFVSLDFKLSQKRDLLSLFMTFSVSSIKIRPASTIGDSCRYSFIQQICATVGMKSVSLIH